MTTATARKLSKDMTPEEKTSVIDAIRQYHSPYLVANDIALKDFNVKSVFTHEGQKVIGLFPNEFRKSKGFYLELIDSFLTPIDPKRTIYRVAPRENFEEVYSQTRNGTYAVPVDELEEIIPSVIEQETTISYTRRPSTKFDNPVVDFDSLEDEHHSKLTIRDIAAIIWQEPVSQKSWLNTLVDSVKK